MSSGIHSSVAHVETYMDNEGHAGLMTIQPTINGSGIAVRLIDQGMEQFYIARKATEVCLVAIPGPKWLQDMKDDGWEIITAIDVKRTP